MTVTEDEQQQITAQVRRFDVETGIEALAVIGRADHYPETPWKAYALGTAIGALLVVWLPPLALGWDPGWSAAFQVC